MKRYGVATARGLQLGLLRLEVVAVFGLLLSVACQTNRSSAPADGAPGASVPGDGAPGASVPGDGAPGAAPLPEGTSCMVSFFGPDVQDCSEFCASSQVPGGSTWPCNDYPLDCHCTDTSVAEIVPRTRPPNYCSVYNCLVNSNAQNCDEYCGLKGAADANVVPCEAGAAGGYCNLGQSCDCTTFDQTDYLGRFACPVVPPNGCTQADPCKVYGTYRSGTCAAMCNVKAGDGLQCVGLQSGWTCRCDPTPSCRAESVCNAFNCTVDENTTCHEYCKGAHLPLPQACQHPLSGYDCFCDGHGGRCDVAVCNASTCVVGPGEDCNHYCENNSGGEAPCQAPYSDKYCICSSDGRDNLCGADPGCNATTCTVGPSEDCNHYCVNNKGGEAPCQAPFAGRSCVCSSDGGDAVCGYPGCNASSCWVGNLDCNHYCLNSNNRGAETPCDAPYSSQYCVCSSDHGPNKCENPGCNGGTCITGSGIDCNHFCVGKQGGETPCAAPFAEKVCACSNDGGPVLCRP